MNIRRGLLAAIIFCGISSPLFARDYYLSPSGSDLADGSSPARALQHISALNEIVFYPGDRIFFEGGQKFHGTLYLDTRIQGAAERRIEISSYGEGRATLTPNLGEDCLSIHDSQGYLIQNLRIDGIQADGRKTIGSGIHIESFRKDYPTAFVSIKNVEISGFTGEDANVARFGAGILIDSERNGQAVTDILIENLSVHDNDHAGIRTLSKSGLRHRRIVIKNSQAFHNEGIPGLVYNTGSGINLGDVSDALVEGSRAYENGRRNTANGGPVGIWAWNSDHVIFRLNESFRNGTAGRTDGGGFDFDGGVTDSVMERNKSYENDGAGFMICGLEGVGKASGIQILNNISVDDGRKNSYSGLMLAYAVSDSLFEGNIFVMRRALHGHAPVARLIEWTGENVRFKNNWYSSEPDVQILRSDGSVPGDLLRESEGIFPGLKPLPPGPIIQINL